MSMNRRMILAGAAGLLAAPGILRAQSIATITPNIRHLRISTGGAGGNYHAATTGEGGIVAFLGNAFPEKAEAQTSPGSLENLRRLWAGETDMAWCQEDVLIDATKTDPALRRAVPVFRQGYVELLQIFAGTANRWDSLGDFAKTGGILGIGDVGGGLGETWRIISTLNKDAEKFYSRIDARPIAADYNRFVTVAETRGTAQAVMEGPGADNHAIANNEVSVVAGSPPRLRLLAVEDDRLAALKRLDGEPLYKTIRLQPRAPVAKTRSEPGSPGFYNNLLPSGGMFSRSGVPTLGVRCLLLMRAEYQAALPRDLATRLGRAIDQALVGVRKRVNPFAIDL